MRATSVIGVEATSAASEGRRISWTFVRGAVNNSGSNFMAQLESNKVIVTGALGWLGISLVQALVKGLPEHEALKDPRGDLRIRCLILPGQDGAQLRKLSDRIEVVTGDVRNAADCAKLCEDSKGGTLF